MEKKAWTGDNTPHEYPDLRIPKFRPPRNRGKQIAVAEIKLRHPRAHGEVINEGRNMGEANEPPARRGACTA